MPGDAHRATQGAIVSRYKCGRCGKDPAEGFASIDGVRYCHGDAESPTCYERGPVDGLEALMGVAATLEPGESLRLSLDEPLGALLADVDDLWNTEDQT
jgi:hypothetical protein